MDYTGKIGTQANGLFAIDYDTQAGKKRALFTQFENSDARRMIPSWDEPAHKATFTLERPCRAAQMAVSNMPVDRDHRPGQRHARACVSHRRRRCRPTCCSSRSAISSAPPRSWARPKSAWSPRTAWSTRRTSRSIPRSTCCASTTTTSASPYPLPKLDNVASPGGSQFFSAMENWGAIFTFEHTLLLDPSDLDPVRQAARVLGRRARDRAPVVRRPGDDELVGRPVAQRRLRHLDGRAHHAEAASGMEHRSCTPSPAAKAR